MPAPTCPVHGYELELHQVTQGDKVLGYMFLCPMDEWGSIGGECTTCIDADMQGNPIFEAWKQLELVEVIYAR